MLELTKPPSCTVEPIESRLSPNPQYPLMIYKYFLDVIRAQAIRVTGIVLKTRRKVLFRINSDETGVPRAYPNYPTFHRIFNNSSDSILTGTLATAVGIVGRFSLAAI